MRQQFIECSTLEEAYDLCPWAAVIGEVEGGYIAFESPDDWWVWLDQQ